jgi:sugar/nucleoside kinase (ribokinase family)
MTAQAHAAAPVAVLGECVADAFVTPAAGPQETPAIGLEVLPGGGPANTAVALGRLGTPTRFLGRLSHDVFGRLFRHHLSSSNVDMSHVVAAPESSTLAVADLDPEGTADYSFHAEGAADWQWTSEELAAGTADPVSALHTGSLALIRPPGGRLIEDLISGVRERATVSVDPNVRPLLVDPAAYRSALPRWCGATDILRLSDDDLEHLAPAADKKPDSRLERAADTFHADGARLVVITLGGGGAFASLDGERLRVPAPVVKVVDSVGAGDSFMAGFLHSLHSAGALGGRLDKLSGEQVADALGFGVRVAAAVVAVRGANPPWAAELRADA